VESWTDSRLTVYGETGYAWTEERIGAQKKYITAFADWLFVDELVQETVYKGMRRKPGIIKGWWSLRVHYLV
jgi:hypothetical protein